MPCRFFPLSNPPDSRQAHGRRTVFAGGFTLVELVVVIVIVGVLAVVAVPRLEQRRTYDTRAFADTVLTAMRYAQKTAVAQRRRIQVATTANSIALTYCTVGAGADTCSAATTVCTAAVSNPGGGTYSASAPSGVTLSPDSTFRFDCLGRPMTDDTASMDTTTFNVTGDQTIPIVVETETGYVH